MIRDRYLFNHKIYLCISKIIDYHYTILNYSRKCEILLKVNPRSFRIPSSRRYTSPWILNYCPSFHACCTTGILATFKTCSFTLSSTSKFSLSSCFPLSKSLYLARTYRMRLSQASRGPWSCLVNEALTPPHP